MINLRPIMRNDFAAVKNMIAQGRRFQNSLGFEQWLEGYPSDALLETDFLSRRGYIIVSEGKTAGYVVVDTKGDEEYERLSHIWNLHGEYAVVHRLVLSDEYRGHGLASHVVQHIEKAVAENGLNIIRFDTGLQNTPMQRLLARHSYTNLGEYDFVWGRRLAYEKQLSR